MGRFPRLPAAVLLGVLLWAAGCGPGGPPPGRSGPGGGGAPVRRDGARPAAWTTYQGSAGHLGDAGPTTGLDPLRRAWDAPLDASAVYGQPLLYRGLVIVATEADDVYALDAATGRVVWRVNLGAPLRGVARWAGCGDVDPLGITSTPVVDPDTSTVYVVAEVSTSGHPPVHHQLVGIDTATGRVTLSVDADPPLRAGQEPLQLLQRAALAIGNGRVYVGYGGHFGDCGGYSGWVVGVAVPGAGARHAAGAAKVAFDVTPGSSGGAVWDGGSGPVVGPRGTVYVTTGNPNSGGPAPWSEAVLQLSPNLDSPPEAVFQDRAASGDLDLSTGGPVLLPDGTVFAVGKTDIGYVARRDGLALVATIPGVCGSDPDGGSAYDGSTASLYVPCRAGGIQQVDLASRRTGWRAGGVNSTPVLAGGNLWALGYPGGILQELDPSTGRVVQSVTVGRRVPTFASVSVAGGLVLVPTRSGVEAFSGPGGWSGP